MTNYLPMCATWQRMKKTRNRFKIEISIKIKMGSLITLITFRNSKEKSKGLADYLCTNNY